jgi:hypothetical protein
VTDLVTALACGAVFLLFYFLLNWIESHEADC